MLRVWHNKPRWTVLRAQVQVHPKRTTAIVVFTAAKALRAALSTAKKGAVIQVPPEDTDTGAAEGLRGMVEAHKAQFPGNQELTARLNDWMVAFEEEEERKRKAAEAAVADDGWTVVTKRAGRKRHRGAPSTQHDTTQPNPTQPNPTQHNTTQPNTTQR